MKRFYREACAAPAADGHRILLDGRPVRTPARNFLSLPTAALAEAVADEWQAQGEEVRPRSMPLTGLANAAIDWVARDPVAFARGLAVYGESDLLCYRADAPAALAARQAALWNPILEWAEARFDVEFEIATGVMHRPQPAATAERLGEAIAARDPFALAALSPLVTVAGSLVIALALDGQAIELDAAWAAATLDEAWQAEQWGEDPEATHALAERRADFEAGYRFLELL